jgi:hypothetical protein
VLSALSAPTGVGSPVAESLCWRDLTLIRAGEARAVIALASESPVQHRQADLLNAIVARRCGRGLPLVDLADIPSGTDARVVVLFGSTASNALVWDLAGDGRGRLEQRLARNGYSCEEFRRGDVHYVGALNAVATDWGTPVLCFAAGLRQEGNGSAP